jgi:hypothetical protein
MKLGILNTSIATENGIYELHPLTLDEARSIVKMAMELDGIDSAVGHQGSADILTLLLGVDVPLNRQQFAQKPTQGAIVLKLKGRLPEGVVLESIEQIEEVGYELKLLVRLPDCCNQPCKKLELFSLY